jgi:hypothetical protein
MDGTTMFCANPECPHVRDTKTAAEYRDGIAVCPECGARLVPDRPAVSSPASIPAARDAPLVVVASFNFRQDADLAVSMLVANGLQACTFADDCGGVDPGLGFATRARVLVPETQAHVALALLRDLKQ